MSGERRLLVVSYFYPPDPAVGGLRVGKFVRYLPEYGWEPTVLTARTIDAGARDDRVHATSFASPWRFLRRRSTTSGTGTTPSPPLREQAARGPLRRLAYAALRHVLPMSSVRMPDATLGWVPYAVNRGRQLLAEGDFDAIFSSSGPPSSHIVAARLQRASGLPWIADYRDLWSDNHWDARVPPFRWAERRLERRTLHGAAVLTSVGPVWTQRLADLHGKPAEVIYNGYDPHDYPRDAAPAPGFTITYVGSLYYPQQNPEPLFQALTAVRDRSTNDSADPRFQIRFLGTAPGPLAALADRYGLARCVRFLPAVSHSESLAAQASSTSLLYLGWHDPAEGLITAKIFEYLGAGRPILAVGPPGSTASAILQQCGMADLSSDPQEIAHRLETWLHQFRQSRTLSFNRDPEAIAAYTRRAQTGRLAGLLDRVSQSEPGAD